MVAVTQFRCAVGSAAAGIAALVTMDRLREKAKKAVRLAALWTVPFSVLVVAVDLALGPVDIPPYALAFLAGAWVGGNPHTPNFLVIAAVIGLENFAFLLVVIFVYLLWHGANHSPRSLG